MSATAARARAKPGLVGAVGGHDVGVLFRRHARRPVPYAAVRLSQFTPLASSRFRGRAAFGWSVRADGRAARVAGVHDGARRTAEPTAGLPWSTRRRVDGATHLIFAA